MDESITKKMIWDPLRKKNVVETPEETVRQWFIRVLRDNQGVPEHMMMSEVPIEFGASRKKYRADIVIYGKNAVPLIIVECKRPEVILSEETLNQALRYSMTLNAKYYIITNGNNTYVSMKESGRIKMLDSLPYYSDICRQ